MKRMAKEKGPSRPLVRYAAAEAATNIDESSLMGPALRSRTSF